jgi:putative endopeptidase
VRWQEKLTAVKLARLTPDGVLSMSIKKTLCMIALFAISTCAQQATPAPDAAASTPSQRHSEPVLPYTPSLDPAAMDRTADPCVDFYEYSCGGWKKMNPIPADQTTWSVYGKLYEDNLNYLRGILEEASTAKDRDAVTQKIGDYYSSCMDEAEVEKLGAKPLQPSLTAIDNLKDTKELASLLATLHVEGIAAVFNAGSTQDPDNSEEEIERDA